MTTQPQVNMQIPALGTQTAKTFGSTDIASIAAL